MTMSQYARPDSAGRLEVACWCAASTVWIPAEMVGESTGSCGRPSCHAPGARDVQRRYANGRRRPAFRPRANEALAETICSSCFRPTFSASPVAICGPCQDEILDEGAA